MFRQPSQQTLLNIRVLSYNVLSSHLATTSQYPTLNPDHLKAEHRLPVVLEKLEQEITAHKKNVVVCLQEVSLDWAGALHTFFANQGFHLVTGLYGKPFNGFMGVALAWPTSLFDVVDVDISRLSDTRQEGWPKEPEVDFIQSLWRGLNGAVAKSMKLIGLAKNENDDPPEHWSLSQSRLNFILTASLRDKESGKIFSVATYHMPCAYYCPMVMTIHAELSILHVLGIAKKHEAPCILAGDFNIKPSEPVYEFLTTRKMDKESPFYPTPLHGMTWEPTLPQGIRSAYAEKLGHEPDFTNYARTKEQEPFIETLDYIFLSPEWNVDSVLELPNRKDASGPFPNLDAKEPSDHIMIATSLSLKP
ncbi:hypothetical protein ACA910_017211 [Epithemia clementina (nom. ined.)]